MRILFLATVSPSRRGGVAESEVLRLASALAGQGAAVRILAPSTDGQLRDEQIGEVIVERFRVPSHSDIERALRLAAHVPTSNDFRPRPLALLELLGNEFVRAVQSRRDFEPDVLHAVRCFPDGLVGTWVGSLANVPLVTTVTGADLRLARRIAASRPTLRHVLRRSAGVTATSSAAATEMARLLSLPQPVVVPLPAARAEFEVGTSRHIDRLLCHVPNGAVDWAEVVLRAVAATRTPVTIDVVADDATRGSLGRMAEELRIPHRVEWRDANDEATLSDLVSAAAAVILSDRDLAAESIVTDALLAGTPVVAVGDGAAVDMLLHDRTGIRVASANPGELARAVDSLLARPDRGASLGAAGRLHALATYAPESVARRLVRLYHDTIGASSA